MTINVNQLDTKSGIVKRLGLGLGTWDLGNGNREYAQSQEMTV